MSKYEANWSTGVLVTAEGGIGFPEFEWESEPSADLSRQEYSQAEQSHIRRVIHLPRVSTAPRGA